MSSNSIQGIGFYNRVNVSKYAYRYWQFICTPNVVKKVNLIRYYVILKWKCDRMCVSVGVLRVLTMYSVVFYVAIKIK